MANRILRKWKVTEWESEKMGKKVQYHWDLDVYQISVETAMRIFEISRAFPKEEIYFYPVK